MTGLPNRESEAWPLSELLEIASRYSGFDAKPSDMIAADLEIVRGDWVEFFDDLERRFGVDLGCISPKGRGGEARDVSLQQLAEIVTDQAPK